MVAGLVAVVLGAILARRGYVATHKKPYAARNGRLPTGAMIITVGFILIIFALLVRG